MEPSSPPRQIRMLEWMTKPALQQVTEHAYWLPPADPDRPSLAAVVGTARTLLLDIGASPAHTARFLDLLKEAGVPAPDLAVLSHGHWDHVFGMSALEVPVIAHTLTAQRLEVLRSYDWSNAALDARVQTGEEAEMCARDIKLELPSPRKVTLRTPDIVFASGLEFNLGGVRCTALHVGGDHAEDACIFHIEPGGLVFLGDCLYEAIYAPERYYTLRIFPLLETVLSLGAEHHLIGHGDAVMTQADLWGWRDQLQQAYELALHPEGDAPQADEDVAYNTHLFRVGLGRSH